MKPESEYILFATIKGLPGLGRAVFSVPKYPVSHKDGGLVWRAQSTVPTEKKIVDAVLFVVLRTK